MIIPVRCFSCGHVLADKWNYYVKKRDERMEEKRDGDDKKKPDDDLDLKKRNMDVKTTGDILDEVGINRICCRRHFLGCVDMMEFI
jgi:DNA-directed RNA polymerase I, II, and III subunit RPABC5